MAGFKVKSGGVSAPKSIPSVGGTPSGGFGARKFKMPNSVQDHALPTTRPSAAAIPTVRPQAANTRMYGKQDPAVPAPSPNPFGPSAGGI